ncbi:hypothetical protein R1sor_011526 [Riccia sorocarpa]|uniref:NAD-dependent epimerase/dehydratase domain-containing protein n=1 Tax=Riccia sorocarpa TaxID=122646 RepID=A0ABD3I4T3_9MARC
MAGKTVVVTGAAGYVASWIVKLLLDRGYNIRGTVRNPDDESKVGHLRNLPGAAERLQLYRAELLREGDFDNVIDGADYVVHSASPVVFEAPDPIKEIVSPSVEGTLNVLRACAKSKTVKRVVHTSSTAAVFFSPRFFNRDPDEVVDESWWSDEKFCESAGLGLWYPLGKARAERIAYEFVRASRPHFDLVSVIVGTCLGASLNLNNENWSPNEIKRILVGEDWQSDPYPELRHTCSVDVEDAALAHVLTMENPSAEGRYMVCESSLSQAQFALILSKISPEYGTKADLKGMDEKTFMKPAVRFTSEKVQKLGLNFTPAEVFLKKTVEFLKQMGQLNSIEAIG